MIEFLYLFLFRALSGAQNGFGYAKKSVYRVITSGLMVAVLAGSLFCWLQSAPESYWKAGTVILVIISIVGTIGVEDSFNPNYQILPKDIHLWEMLATGGITLAWMALGGNLISIAASIYPGLILHKGFINLGSGQKWWYAGTDDRTGKTFSIPLLNIKVPRLGTMGRISIAVASVMAMIINTSLHWRITVQDVIAWVL
ncbi:hypothetical protein [Flavilitoribacter nigricans]|nr:hypothetical protein [Flavilitoribacter nigricans]